jgi:hypothetical protein
MQGCVSILRIFSLPVMMMMMMMMMMMLMSLRLDAGKHARLFLAIVLQDTPNTPSQDLNSLNFEVQGCPGLSSSLKTGQIYTLSLTV